MTDPDWEPWNSLTTTSLRITDSEGVSIHAPFSAYAGTFQEAKNTMMIHLGVELREHGFHPAWLRED